MPARTDLEALEICDEFSGGIQLLITDVILPEVSGLELAARVQSIRPEAQVLFISGLARDEITDSALPFLMKPFRLDELLERVRLLIGEPTVVPARLQMSGRNGVLANW